MKKMAVKIIVPILALFMLLSMVSSVKAFVPPTKTAITAIDLTFVGPTGAKYVVCNNIVDEFFKSTGTVAIYKGTYTYTSLPTAPFAIASFVDIWWGTYNIATNTGCYTAYEVWTVPDTATFVGFDHPVITTGDFLSTLTGYPGITALSSHITLAGTCASAGQAIDLASSNLLVYPWTGYWLTP